MNSHANVKFGMIFQFLANLQGAQHWGFRGRSKDQRAAIAGRQAEQVPFRFSDIELLGAAHNFL